MKVRFSRSMQQEGLIDLEASKKMNIRMGFRVFPGAKVVSNASITSDFTIVEIPELKETRRTILTRRVKKKCDPDS